MPAKRSLSFALALLLAAAIPARASSFPTIHTVDLRPGIAPSNALHDGSAELDGWLYFSAYDDTHGYELWRTNGTTSELVKDTVDGPGTSYPGGYTTFKGYIYFAAWVSGNHPALWRTDGTAAHTEMIKDIAPDAELTSLDVFTVSGDTLYFRGYDPVHRNEIWRSDGTAEGTYLVRDIHPANDGSAPWNLTANSGYLYFTEDDGVHGTELWRTDGIDGTETHTQMVKDIKSTGADSSSPGDLTPAGSYLYFLADDGTNGYELWRTDGTEANTAMVEDLGPATSIYGMTAFKGSVYMSADDGVHGFALWRSDGTAATMELIKGTDPVNENGYGPESLTVVGNWLYYSNWDSTHSTELWRTDGTTANTTLVSDIYPGVGESYPERLVALGDALYFIADSGAGKKFYRASADGSLTSSTITGSNVSYGYTYASIGGRLFIPYSSDETGQEFAYLDEPTFGLPGTNRDGSGWSTALVLLAAVTAVAGVALRMRRVRHGLEQQHH
jgi:ELWxxDGT repeat protein